MPAYLASGPQGAGIYHLRVIPPIALGHLGIWAFGHLGQPGNWRNAALAAAIIPAIREETNSLNLAIVP